MSSFHNPVSSFINRSDSPPKPKKASRRPMSAQISQRRSARYVSSRGKEDSNTLSQSIIDKVIDSQPVNSQEPERPAIKSRNSQRKLVSKTQNLKETINQLNQNPQSGDPLEDQKVRTIWRTFGSYIAKQLINGKGVVVPGFGVFSFSATEVNLTGTTNPQARDRQIREPVFIVSKDFSQILKSGLYSNQLDTIRPLEVKGVNGAIPQVKINFIEISVLCNESKEFCRESCDKVFKHLSNKAKKGEQISVELPLVGRFIVRNQIAAVNFTESLVLQTRGQTVKTFTVGNIFGNSNATHNLSMGITRSSIGGAIKVNDQAEMWLKNNLGIDINSLPSEDQAQRKGNNLRRSGSVQQIPTNFGAFNEERLSVTSQQYSHTRSRSSRPMSAQASHKTTEMASHMSQLPKTDKFTLVQAAQNIFTQRQQISISALKLKTNLREILPSSKILRVLRLAGVNIDIITIKQLLNELGFAFNGPSTSLTLFITALKALLYGQRQFEGRYMRQSDTASEISNLTGFSSRHQLLGRISSEDQKSINTIRDIFYTTQKNLFDLFKLGMCGNTVDLDGFKRIVTETSGGVISPAISEAIFKAIARQNVLTFELFEKTFRSEIPTSLEMETKVIRNIRDWMYRNNLSAEMAFESFCRVVGNHTEKKLTRAQFHRALITLDVGLSAAQTDALFASLVSEANGLLEVNMWLSRIYDDGDNPLQMIREIVSENNLTQEDLLLQMKLKAWDNPLSYTQLTSAIRSLDQSISDVQIRSLYSALKNSTGQVSVTDLIQNLTGKQFETIDFKNKIQKQIYQELFTQKEDLLLQACQNYDKNSNGTINRNDLATVLKQLSSSISAEDIDRYIKFLEVDLAGNVSYLKYIDQLAKQVNRNHNPFRAIVNRLAYFLKHNGVNASELMARITQDDSGKITVSKFADFLKQKVDKKAELQQLQKLAARIDVDQDGKICETDILTCIKNLSNGAFWRSEKINQSNLTVTNFNPVERKLSKQQLEDLIDKINEALNAKQISYKKLFENFDVNNDQMVSLAEFVRGLTSILQIAVPFAEQIYAVMDKRGVGLVTYDQFLEVLKSRKIEPSAVSDNFTWEYETVEKIREWINTKKLTIEDSFKSFDRDFDGQISKNDLKHSLASLLEIPTQQLVDAKIDRLFNLLDTFKAGAIQLSDFKKLFRPAQKAQLQDDLNWKQSAIKQIGLNLSKKYSSSSDSFNQFAKESQKINFETFVAILRKENLLHGFNLTTPLYQELFSQMDPHKKGFISCNDWCNNFDRYNYIEQKLSELKAIVASTFANCESAFNFLLTFGKSQSIVDQVCFKTAVRSITNGRFIDSEIAVLWKKLSENDQVDIYTFRKHFEELNFQGNQTVTSLKSLTNASKKSKLTQDSSFMRTTIRTSSGVTEQWERNVIEKMQSIIITSAKPIHQIFNEFDQDGNGFVTAVEFRNAIRKLNLGLSSKEIDQLMMRIDVNGDGQIDYNEFIGKFGNQDNQQSQLLHQRAKEKLAQLKELMILHMNSVVDAFRYFDKTKNGTLAFSEFDSLVKSCYHIAKLESPAFSIIKDIFDLIDVRQDGQIDLTEWQQTFGRVTEGGSQLTIKPTPLSLWESSKEFEKIGKLMAKSRKLLIEKFRQAVGGKNKTLFNFQQGRAALDDWLYQNFKEKVTDAHLKCVFAAAQIPSESQNEPHYDYLRLLDLYKARYLGPQQ